MTLRGSADQSMVAAAMDRALLALRDGGPSAVPGGATSALTEARELHLDTDVSKFWIGSIVVCAALLVFFGCCVVFKGEAFLERWVADRNPGGIMSDQIRIQRIIERRRLEKESKQEDPEQRRERLRKLFREEGLIMVGSVGRRRRMFGGRSWRDMRRPNAVCLHVQISPSPYLW